MLTDSIMMLGQNIGQIVVYDGNHWLYFLCMTPWAVDLPKVCS